MTRENPNTASRRRHWTRARRLDYQREVERCLDNKVAMLKVQRASLCAALDREIADTKLRRGKARELLTRLEKKT